MSTSELAASLSTSLDALDLWNSRGKSHSARFVSSSPASTSRGTMPNDAELLHQSNNGFPNTLVNEEAQLRTQLLEQASESVHALSCVTMTDDETATIRSLPRATLEALVLASCATYRAHRGHQLASLSGSDDGAVVASSGTFPHPFGSTLGPQFDALVAVKRAKHALDAQPSLLPQTQMVHCERATEPLGIPVEQLEPGDLMILTGGSIVPCDALLLSTRRVVNRSGEDFNGGRTLQQQQQQCDVFINVARITGSTLPLERRAGHFQPCERFGSMTILPQQSLVQLQSGSSTSPSGEVTSPDETIELLAVALRSAESSSWMARQHQALAAKAASNASSNRLNDATQHVETLPLFVVPIPSIHQFERCAVLRAATCQTVIIEVEGVLLDESAYSVTSAVWGGQWYSAANGVTALLHNHPVPVQDASSGATSIDGSQQISDVTASSSHVNTRHAIHSFVSNASSGSRVAAMGTGPGLQSLAIAMMLATAYGRDSTAPIGSIAIPVGADAPEASIKRFLVADAHVCDVLRHQYQPLSHPTVLRWKGHRITARLFGYTSHLPRAARGDTQRHAVLVIHGDARTVLAMSAFMASAKGQVRIDRGTEQLLQHLESSAVCAPEYLFGVATADILWDYVGTKNIPSPTDLAALLAQTTSLCYQGAYVCEVGVRRNVVEGAQRLAAPVTAGGLGLQVVFASSSRTPQQLQHLLGLRCHLGSSGLEIVTPDPLGRWLDDKMKPFEPTRPTVIGFASAPGSNSANATQHLVNWSRRRTEHSCACNGVVYCGRSCGAVVGFSASDVAVVIEPQDDAVCRTVLRNGAAMSIAGFGIDDLAEALTLARQHIHLCSPSSS